MTRRFRPILPGASLRDCAIACLGAAICLALTAAACTYAPLAGGLPAIVAPLGASAVLVFAVPASPLAQPWPVIGGKTILALVGVAVYHLVPSPPLAAGVAVGAAILVMSLARCLHPPGGAAAVIGGPTVHAAGFTFALLPVALNSVALVALAIAFHRLSGHAYPHRAPTAATVRTEQRAASECSRMSDRGDCGRGAVLSRRGRWQAKPDGGEDSSVLQPEYAASSPTRHMRASPLAGRIA